MPLPGAFSSVLADPKLRRAARLMLALLLGVVSVLAWRPNPGELLSSGTDKLAHLLAFGALGACAALGFGLSRWRRIGVGLMAYGALIEWVQAFIPGRSAEWLDLGADGIGALLGVLLVAWVSNRIDTRR